MKSNLIKLFSPSINNKEIDVVTKVLKSKFWSSGSGIGNVLEFEKKFCDFTNANECVAVNSGTAALHLALAVSNIDQKEVLVTPLTFVSTIHSIKHNGGIPVFVDIDPKTLCIDPTSLEEKISKNTKAILPVHFGGYPCNLKKIKKIAKNNSLTVVEDAAHACGSSYDNQKIGSLSEFTCFSFHPVKNLAMPKGGAITLNMKNSHDIKNKLNSLRWCGIDNRKGIYYDVTSIGFNYYMDEISASIGLIQLKKLEKMNKRRKKIAQKYSKQILIDNKMPYSNDCSYHLYWIKVKNRTKFIKNMNDAGIEVGIHYKPAHLMKIYMSSVSLPSVDTIWNEIVTLPIYPDLTDNQVEYIIKNTNKFV